MSDGNLSEGSEERHGLHQGGSAYACRSRSMGDKAKPGDGLAARMNAWLIHPNAWYLRLGPRSKSRSSFKERGADARGVGGTFRT